jgi:hypothetical protein
MSNILRVFSKHARSLPQPSKSRIVTLGRLFHSPFVVLNSPLSPASSAPSASLYEKQHDHSPEPQISSSGTRTYVVSEPDPANTPYAVPSGAYPTTAPYVNFKPTDAPSPEGKHSSNSASLNMARAVPRNADGVGENASVRYGGGSGGMGPRGGVTEG